MNFHTRTRKKMHAHARTIQAHTRKIIASGGKYQKDQNHDFGTFQHFQILRNEKTS